MFHRDQLGNHGHKFPADLNLQIPEPDDNWRQMNFDHGPNDPQAPGISPEERRRRMEYLDKVWWPEVLANVAAAHQGLPPGSFIKSWQQHVQRPPHKPSGFEVADADEYQ